MRKRLSAYIDCDIDAGTALTKTRLRKPNYARLELDTEAGTSLQYGQVTTQSVKLLCDSDANTGLLYLRRTTLGRRPNIQLSAWSNDGMVKLDGLTIRRGDLTHIQVDVIGSNLYHFVLATFMLKGSLNDANEDAIIWKTNQPDKGGIERISTIDTTDKFGAAKHSIYQIGIDPRDTASLTSRRILHWEFQLDDTLGEVYSIAGTITITPDVYQYP